MWRGIQIIAEVKTKSPFGYLSKNSWEELFEIANEVGDIISIHTDSRWGGSMDALNKARNMTKKPILAKGIHEKDEEIKRCLEIVADFVLVVGRIPKFSQEKLMVEPNSLQELSLIPENIEVVWNSRDLSNGGLKSEMFSEARLLFGGWLCQASNIRTYNDIDINADAVLIGTNLLGFRDLKSL